MPKIPPEGFHPSYSLPRFRAQRSFCIPKARLLDAAGLCALCATPSPEQLLPISNFHPAVLVQIPMRRMHSAVQALLKKYQPRRNTGKAALIMQERQFRTESGRTRKGRPPLFQKNWSRLRAFLIFFLRKTRYLSKNVEFWTGTVRLPLRRHKEKEKGMKSA